MKENLGFQHEDKDASRTRSQTLSFDGAASRTAAAVESVLRASVALPSLSAIQSTLLLQAPAKLRSSMKNVFPRGSAIKNSADEDPEGYSTNLDTPMCNGDLVPFLPNS